MTRGRRKDLTIPPSRALLQQRDYRARKAQYLADLEERVRRAEGENVELKQEVDQLKSRLRQENGGPSTYAQELHDASSELMSHLHAAQSSLERFRNLALDKPPFAPDIRMEVDEPMTSSRSLPPPRGQQAPSANAMPTLSSSTTLRPPGYPPLSHSSQQQSQYQQQQPRSLDPYSQSQQSATSSRTNSNYTLHPSRHTSNNGYATPLQSNHPSPYTPPSPSGSSRSGDGVSRATQSPHRDQLPSLHQLNLPPLRLNSQTSPYPAHQQPARLHPDPNPPYPSNGARSPYDSRYGNHHPASVSSHDTSDSESDDEDPRNIHVVAPSKSVGRLSLVTSDVRSASSSSSRSGSERA